MIKNYLITYEKKQSDGRYIESTLHHIKIPALTLFDAVDYAHNTLELEDITEVVVFSFDVIGDVMTEVEEIR